MSNFRPSPAIVVPADLPISEAIKKMREANVGSVLVVREILPHDLVGIFTERDLVRKIDKIQSGGYWDKGIASIMTKPVYSLSVYELSKAPEVMYRRKIRHLPIVYFDEQQMQHVVGVISMRDLYESYYRAGVEPVLSRVRESPPRIGLASKDKLSLGMFRTILSQNGKAKILEIDPEQLVDELKEYLEKKRPDVLVMDLDFLAPARWAKFLQQINHIADAPFCILLFTPSLHQQQNVKVISKISDLQRLAAFEKPMNVLSFLQKIETALEPRLIDSE